MASQELVPSRGEVIDVTPSDLSVARPPDIVIQEAHRAASVLRDVIASKAHKVSFNGRQYLEFEDWQTVGRFYGLTARVRETKYIEYGDAKGFEAIADAVLVGNGQVVSTAEAMCLNDERNWKSRTLNQIRSMAQTRACAKALRNVLSWVVVLAGYAPTPAEEMDRDPEAERQEQQHVARRKIEDATPAELRSYLAAIDSKQDGSLSSAFRFVQDELIKAGGKDGDTLFIAQTEALRARHPKGTPIPTGEAKGVILVLWGEVERLRKLKAQREKDEADSAFAVSQ